MIFYRIKPFALVLTSVLMTLLLAGCDLFGGEEPAAVPTPETIIIVATPTPDPAVQSGDVEEEIATAEPPTAEPTEAPASADAEVLEPAPVAETDPTMTSIVDLNVRRGPSVAYDIVGALPAGTSAKIVGKAHGWWKIECPSNVSGECWASGGSEYSSAVNAEGVTDAAVPPTPTQPATATYTATPTSEHTATATTDPNATATATTDANATATATTDANATATATTDANATATATIEHTPTPTEEAVPTAAPDNDSLQAPSLDIFMSPTGTRNFSKSDAISYPNGDPDDWVAFEFPNNSNSSQQVWVTLSCELSGNVGNAQMVATVWEDGVQQLGNTVICNSGEQSLTVDNTKKQTIQIYFNITNDGVYGTYNLSVVGYK